MEKQKSVASAEKTLCPTEVVLTCRMKMTPDKKALSALMKTMRKYRDAANYISGYAFRFKKISPLSLHNRFYHDIRERFGLPSQLAESVFLTVAAAYKALNTKNEWTAPARFRRPMASWVFSRDYKLEGGIARMKTMSGWFDIPVETKGWEVYLDGLWAFGTARITLQEAGLFLEMPVRRSMPALPVGGDTCVVGIDLGLRFLAVSYDSYGKTHFYSGREIKHRRQQFQNQRRELQKKAALGAKRRLKAIGNQESRCMNDANHRISKKLVESYPPCTVFILEDLTGISVKLRKKYGASYSALANWAYFDLQSKIQYKALKRGGRVISVALEGTSQTCPVCGNRSQSNRNRFFHEFKCTRCGYTTNDDRAAAMNIFHRRLNALRSVRAGQVS